LKKPGTFDYDLNTNLEVPVVGMIYTAGEGSPTCNTLNETIKTCMDIAGVNFCTHLVISMKKFREHEDERG
jgi:hypothetical protein